MKACTGLSWVRKKKLQKWPYRTWKTFGLENIKKVYKILLMTVAHCSTCYIWFCWNAPIFPSFLFLESWSFSLSKNNLLGCQLLLISWAAAPAGGSKHIITNTVAIWYRYSKGGHAKFFCYSANIPNPEILGLIPQSQIRKFPRCASPQIPNLPMNWLIRKKHIRKFHWRPSPQIENRQTGK